MKTLAPALQAHLDDGTTTLGGVIIVASVVRRALGARAGPLRGGAAGGRPPHRWLTGWAGRSATVAVQRPS